MTKEEAYNIWKNMKIKDQMVLLKMFSNKRTIMDKQIAAILHIQQNSHQYVKSS